MKLEFTPKFNKALKRLPKDRANRIKTALKRFIEAPERTGIRLHKLEAIDAYSLSARKDRIIMEKLENDGQETWRLLDVGAHDNVYRRANRR
jgi:mRNA-degrading endonuclease RelE of RelBE toxin-antitoxin system